MTYMMPSLDAVCEIIDENFNNPGAAAVEQASAAGELPLLGDGLKAERAEVLSTAYPVSADGHGTARYQMQCRIYYCSST